MSEVVETPEADANRHDALHTVTASTWRLLPHQVLSVARFEFRRTSTPARLAVWAALMLFPMVILTLVTSYEVSANLMQWAGLLYVLVPQVTCLLALLLWVAPNINSELEGRTWFYLTARPSGRIALLLGKYINGVLWTATAGWIAGTLATAVLVVAMAVGVIRVHGGADTQDPLAPPGIMMAQPTESASIGDVISLGGVLLWLVTLSSAAYGAICTLIAVVLPRRAMMVCVAYVLIAEVFLANTPAVINELTVHHRLINILARSFGWETIELIPATLDEFSTWVHFAALACYTVGLLVVAAIVMACREYITSDQS